jgi:hypothetical protein
MQAILTRYLGPTNTRGSRIKASCAAGSITIGYPHELSGQAVYRKAAEALVAKLGWDEIASLLGGCLPTGDYCFVFNAKVSEE